MRGAGGFYVFPSGYVVGGRELRDRVFGGLGENERRRVEEIEEEVRESRLRGVCEERKTGGGEGGEEHSFANTVLTS